MILILECTGGILHDNLEFCWFRNMCLIFMVKVKLCYNQLRLGTVIVLVSSGIDFVNTPRLYSHRATRLKRLPIWPYHLYQREPKVPVPYKKHTATELVMPEMRLEPLNVCLTDRRLNQLS